MHYVHKDLAGTIARVSDFDTGTLRTAIPTTCSLIVSSLTHFRLHKLLLYFGLHAEIS
jgi:hypothetical protein